MDEQPKCTKIAVRVEFADGTSADLEALEPEDVTVAVHHPEPDYDLGNPVRLVSTQPPPTVTLRFTANEKRGYTERINVPDDADWRARIEASLARIATRLDAMPPH